VLQLSGNTAIDNKSIKDVSLAPIPTTKGDGALVLMGDGSIYIIQFYKTWVNGQFEFLIPLTILW
jgi:hypothetical protein